MIGQIFVDCYLPLALPGTFTYRMPIDAPEVYPGSLVIVPFNERNIYTGIVKRVHDLAPIGYLAKEAIEILEQMPVLSPFQFKLLDWISEYYLAEPGLVFHAAIPSGLKISTESKIQLNPVFEEANISLSENEFKLIEALKTVPALGYPEALKVTRTKSLHHILQSLRKKGAILLFEEYKHLYKPKIISKIRLAERFADDKELLKNLMDSLAGQEKQENILLKYLQEVPIWKNTNSNINGIAKSQFSTENFSPSALKTLIKKEVLVEFREVVARETYEMEESKGTATLSEEQKSAYEAIKELFNTKETVLLQGITGSGKTEIYVQLIHTFLEKGQQCLFLMPEIALTAHMTGRLSAIFGNQLGIYHSRLSENERVETWKRVQTGDLKVILGARSSVFLHFNQLGFIVVDEEHDTSFKQNEKAPRYHGRDAALYLARLFRAKTLLGSATPSLESYHLARKGSYGYVLLDKRHGASTLPDILYVDLRAEKKTTKPPSAQLEYSPQLIAALEESLAAKEQAIVFQNRRGYSPYLCCETCGWVSMCPQCAVSLTYHQRDKRLKCHYCGNQQKIPATCPACGSGKITTKGMGTEKIEEDLATLLPSAKIHRMDQDTTRAKNAFNRIYQGLKSGEIDILVGTQMLTKGLDFDNINFAGVLNADQMMYFPDFRANERTFQLLTQVAGRTGRREKKGKVLAQTYNPNHYLLQYLKQNDLHGFYARELSEREKFHYPPFTRLIKLTVKDKDKHLCEQAALEISRTLVNHFGQGRVLGPEWPPIDRINNFFLKEILLKFEREKVDVAKAKILLKSAVLEFGIRKEFRSTQVIVDVDPY